MRQRSVTLRRGGATKSGLDRRWFAARGAVSLLSSLSAPRGISAPLDAAEFDRGKTIRILVGSPPGGGYDLYARLIAPYLAKKLDAQVIIENRAGGSGLLAL